jgi:hypothetical protein
VLTEPPVPTVPPAPTVPPEPTLPPVPTAPPVPEIRTQRFEAQVRPVWQVLFGRQAQVSFPAGQLSSLE